ncbi:NAD(P)/FAD-dependent oxidoreductase [Salibacteraceae bacterium]|nr:NAD(P)/FAD-dependent oxidoreductase [Salibacteraceae bacterium]
MKIAVIGGGAAGFFAAISAKTHHPDAEVHLIEKSSKLLSKVLISGGGRCNVTHACFNNTQLSKYYPRGERFLKKAFEQFNVEDTVNWYKAQGVDLKIEDDGRMFPISNDSRSIANALLDQAKILGVIILLNSHVKHISKSTDAFHLNIGDEKFNYDNVIIASGGSPKKSGLSWLEELGHDVVSPVPSLFTFNMPKESITHLMGVNVPKAKLRIRNTKLETSAPLLITHWGMSGPAVLKLSAFGAIDLAALDYTFSVQVNWLDTMNESNLRIEVDNQGLDKEQKKIANRNPFALPSRLWEFLLRKSQISLDKRWIDLSKKELNRLVNTLTNDDYKVDGKTTFKEEFVTAGGVDLNNIEVTSMQSKKLPGVYFCGEVMDIDGVTGGFNFQAAWTTGWIAGKLKSI